MTELNLVGGQTIYSRAQIVKELQREIAMRRRVYGRMVETGAMTQDVADYRVGIMEQIAQDYSAKGK